MLRRLSAFVLAVTVFTTVLPIQAAQAARWYWVPSRITNGSPGRAVLTRDSTGPIGKLLGSLGMYWSHSGMFIDAGYNIRHNTANPDTFKVVDSSGRGCSGGGGITCVPHRFNSATLVSAQPGIITQSVAEAYGENRKPEFSFYDQESNGTLTNRNAAVLLRRNVTPIGGSIYYDGAADKMVDYEAFYSFYSYTDIWQTEPDPSDPSHIHVAPDLNRKNMCSGTVAWALYSGGGFDIWPLGYPASLRNTASPVLYRAIYDEIGKKTSSTVSGAFMGAMLLNPTGVLLPGAFAVASIANATRERMANQFVNCMAFNDCGNTTNRWRNGVGDGASLSPDNLLPMGVTNPNGGMWGVSGYDPANQMTLWYDSVEGISYTGGYWKQY